jgi:phosphomethylpyrimidine synthase
MTLDENVLKNVARIEGVDVDFLKRGVNAGRIIVFGNVKRKNVKPVAIGEGLTTKVNVNIGTSGTVVNIDMEVEKAKVAVEYGADTIMDLSTGGNIDEIRRILLKASEPLPFGTVPTYQA